MARTAVLLALAWAASTGSQAFAQKSGTPVPRNASGHPDLQGVWSSASLTPLERPAAYANREFLTEQEAADYAKRRLTEGNKDRRDGGAEVDVGRSYNNLFYDHGDEIARTRRTSLVVDPPDGRIPAMTPAGKAKLAASRAHFAAHPADGPEDRPLPDRCLMFSQSGPPMIPGNYNNNYQIIQTGDAFGIMAEMGNQARTMPIEARKGDIPRPPASLLQWTGVSIAHWEGDDLVIETSNFRFNDKSRFGVQYDGGMSDENLRITERFTMKEKDWILYRATIEDPTIFTRPWTFEASWGRVSGPLYEYACHEGNYAMVDMLAGERAKEKVRRQQTELHPQQ
ncbi:MAG TPA: hypothetical protein VG273_15320 [Bryobacteraceae bacterium]|jgi:hypothetical protein|nr:hypothetical protein [Bryobacteraceae bacterium]